MIIIKEEVSRCPKDKEPAYHHKCLECPFRGIIFTVDKPDRALSHNTRCKYEDLREKKEVSKSD